ncbi:MAG: GNAT family N-acetyltransferase [Actinomycetota bacterium]
MTDHPTTSPSERAGEPLAEPTLFHSEPWRQAVEQTFDLKILPFTPRSEPTGLAWYSELADIRGERIVATPFSDFCDPLIETEAGWREFADHLRAYERPVTLRPFRNRLAIGVATDGEDGDHDRDGDGFERRRELLWHGVDLTAGADAIWDGLKTKLRTTIRRAPKTGLRFRFSNSMDDVVAFHRMHVDLRKTKYGLLAQPLQFFEALHDRFGDDMAVLIAEEDDGSPAAAMVYFAWNGVWYYKFSASYPRRYRPNSAMLMEACREGVDRGLDLLDMGRSDLDQPGLVDFKRQFASEELELTTLHWTPPDWDDPVGAEVGRLLGQVTELFTGPDVPNELTAQAGALLYRYFG